MNYAILSLAALLTGCASFVSGVTDGHPNRKEIYVPPGSTAITLAAGAQEDSDRDGAIKIPRGAGAFRANAGRIERDGYMTAVIQRRLNWWIAGNWFCGGFPGLGIDFLDGAAYNPTVVYLAEPSKVASK